MTCLRYASCMDAPADASIFLMESSVHVVKYVRVSRRLQRSRAPATSTRRAVLPTERTTLRRCSVTLARGRVSSCCRCCPLSASDPGRPRSRAPIVSSPARRLPKRSRDQPPGYAPLRVLVLHRKRPAARRSSRSACAPREPA